ncbi:hypothetical protein YC2023_115505 [Brassica napus]
MVICLLRFAKIGQYRGEVQISNAYDASQMFVNPEIQEADEFKQRLPVHIGEERVCGVLLRSLNQHRSEKTFVFIFALFDMSRCCRNIEDHAWAWASI